MKDKFCLEVRFFNHNRSCEEALQFKGETLLQAETRFDTWREKQGRHCSVINVAYLENGKPVGG